MNNINNKDNIKKIFIIVYGSLFVLFMHYFQPNPGGQGIHIPFNATSWIAIGLIVFVGLYKISKFKTVRYSKFTIIFFISCILLTIPVFYSNARPSDAIYRIIGLWSGWLLFLVFQQFRFNKKECFLILWFIFIGTFIEALYAWFQFKYFSFDNFFGYDTLVNRPYGIFQQPNVMASFLATGLAISGYLLSLMTKKFEIKYVYVILSPILFIPIITVLNSRTGWICSIISILLILPFCFFYTKYRVYFSVWAGSLILGIVLSASSVTNESWNGGDNKLNFNSLRAIHIPQAFSMLLEKPLMGYGYGNFEKAYIEQTAEWHSTNSEEHPGIPELTHPHNEILYWGVEGGFLPLIAIFLVALSIIKNLSKFNLIKSLALISILFPIVFHTMLEYPFYHSIIHWVILIVLIFFIDFISSSNSYYSTVSFNKSIVIRIFNCLYFVFILIYMITSLYSGLQLNKFESSRPYDIKYLERVNNKISWQMRYEWDMEINKLRIGIQSNNHDLILNYIKWAKRKIIQHPKPNIYLSLIDAYDFIGDTNNYERTKKEYQFLYPNNK
ncbi:TPA: Wzy polymerase domain-containing protein [Photobacterium damselae]